MKIAIVAVLHLDRLIIHTSGLGPIKQYFQRNFVLSTLIFSTNWSTQSQRCVELRRKLNFWVRSPLDDFNPPLTGAPNVAIS